MGTTNVLRVQARIAAKSGLPEDVVTNTFHFLLDPALDTNLPTDWDAPSTNGVDSLAGVARNLVAGFFDAVKQDIAGNLMVDGLELRSYKLLDPKPRQPEIDLRPAIAWQASASVFPKEVACCVSYSSGLPGQRGRGRIYLGPLVAATSAIQSATQDVAPTGTFIARVNAAAKAMADFDSEVKWSVYSPTLGQASVINKGYVDNALDIQRRRGATSTARTEWTKAL